MKAEDGTVLGRGEEPAWHGTGSIRTDNSSIKTDLHTNIHMHMYVKKSAYRQTHRPPT